MKNRKIAKIIFIFLSLLFIFIFTTFSEAQTVMPYQKDDFDIKPLSNGSFILNGFSQKGINRNINEFQDRSKRIVIIPDEWNITEIADYAFFNPSSYSNDNIKISYLDISNNVKRIGIGAFKNSEIKTLVLGTSLRTIENEAFISNNKITTDFSVATSLEDIGSLAFQSSGISVVTLPDSVRTIKDSAFRSSSVTDLTLNEGLKIIGDYAFGNNKLQINRDLRIPDSVEIIGNNAFAVNKAKRILISANSKLKEIGVEAFNGITKNSSDSFNLMIPDTLVRIGSRAFFDNNIDQITFNPTSKVENIGEYAFYNLMGNKYLSINNSGLVRKLFIPKTVNHIGSQAFENTFFSEIEFQEGSVLTDILEGTFELHSNHKAVTSKVTIPASVVSIGREAFKGYKLEAVAFESGSALKSIGYEAFSLKELDNDKVREPLKLPTTVNSLGEKAFFYYKASDINIEELVNLKKISDSVFRKAIINEDRILTIKNTIISIEEDAFNECRFKGIEFDANSVITSISENAFSGSIVGNTVLTIPNSLIKIEKGAFSSCNLSGLEFQENSKLRIIDSSAFSGQNYFLNQPNITFPDSLEEIRSSAFQSSKIGSTNLGDLPNLRVIGSYAFSGSIVGQDTISFNNPKLTKVEANAFLNCGFRVIDFPNRDVKFGMSVFQKNDNLTDINFSSNMKEISHSMFEDCDTLEEVDIPGNIKIIGDEAFKNSLKLRRLIINEGVEEIGDSAFSETKINNIRTFPSSLKKIKRLAFYRTELSEIDFGENIEEIGNSAFKDINTLVKVRTRGNILFGNSVFNDCNKLVDIELDDRQTVIPDEFISNSRGSRNDLKYFKIPRDTEEIGISAFSNCSLEHFEFNEKIKRIGDRAFHYNKLKKVDNFPESLVDIGKSAFGANELTNFNVLNDYLKKEENFKILSERYIFGDSKGYGSGSMYGDQIISFHPRGSNFRPPRMIDAKGEQVEFLPDIVIKNKDSTYTFKEEYLKQNQQRSYRLTGLLGYFELNISPTRQFKPKKATTTVKRGVKSDIRNWLENPPIDATIVVDPDIDYNQLGRQQATLNIKFTDGSESHVSIEVEVVESLADAWTPAVNILNIRRGTPVIPQTAITNIPSEATLISTGSVDTNIPGVTQTEVVFGFKDGSTKVVKVTVNVTDNLADAWVPELEILVADRNRTGDCVDLFRAVKNEPTSQIEVKNIRKPVCRNIVSGDYIGEIYYRFTDKSEKIVPVHVIIQDLAKAFIPNTKELKTNKGFDINIATGLLNNPVDAITQVVKYIDINKAYKQVGNLKIIFSDGSEKVIDIIVNVVDTLSEASKFTPIKKKLKVFKMEPVDLTKGIKNIPTTATPRITKPVDTSTVGEKEGIVTIKFYDKSELDVVVQVEVVEREIFEIDPGDDPPVTHKKVEFRQGNGVKLGGENVGKIYAVKIGTIVNPKYFPDVTVMKGYREDYIWTPEKNIEITQDTVFIASSELDTRNLAGQFKPKTKRLTVYRNAAVDLTKGLINPPDNSNIIEKVRVNTKHLGEVTGTIEIEFLDDRSKLDVDINVLVVEKPDSKADRFIPKTKMLEVNLGSAVDIKEGLLNPKSEYESLEILRDVSTVSPGQVIGSLLVIFDDGSAKEVQITVRVKNTIINAEKTKADKFIVNKKSLEVFVGDPVNIREGLLNNNLGDVEVVVKQDVETVLPGQKIGVLSLKFDDGSILDVNISVLVKKKIDNGGPIPKSKLFVPLTKVLKVLVGDAVNIRDGLLNDNLNDVQVRVKDDVETVLAGQKIGVLELIFDDGSILNVNITVIVERRPENNTNSKAKMFNPITETLEVFVGDTVDVRTGLKNDLENITVYVKQNVDTTFVGQKVGTLQLVFDDGSVLDVGITVIVKPKVIGNDRLIAEDFIPNTKTLEVFKGDGVDIREGLLNDLDDETEVVLKQGVDTSSTGQKVGVLKIIFKDGSVSEVQIVVLVKERINNNIITEATKFMPNTKILEVFIGDLVDIREGLLNSPEEYKNLSVTRNVQTIREGQVVGELAVEFEDGSVRLVEIVVKVKYKTQENPNPNPPVNPPVNPNPPSNGDTNVIIINQGSNNGGSSLNIGGSTIVTDNSSRSSNNKTTVISNSGDTSSSNGFIDGDSYLKSIENKNITNNNFNIMNNSKDKIQILGSTKFKKYLTGYKDGTVRPDGKVSRAEAVTMLVRLKNTMLQRYKKGTFKDISGNEWFKDYVATGMGIGFITGYPDKTFKPDQLLTRAEFVTMISKIDKKTNGVSKFSDVSESYWAKKYIDMAYSNGRLDGYPDGTFKPNDHISRAEALSIINKLLNVDFVDFRFAENPNQVLRFKDLMRSHWAYNVILTASNSFDVLRYRYLNDLEERYKLININN